MRNRRLVEYLECLYLVNNNCFYYATESGYEIAHDLPLLTNKRSWTNYTPADLKSRSSSTAVSGMYFTVILYFILIINEFLF